MRSILFISTFPILMAGVWICERTQSIEAIGLSESDLALLRSEVREIIRPSCGSCHTSGLPTAKAKALTAFDLKNEDWSAGMTADQLKGFEKRLDKFSESEKVKVGKLLLEETRKQETGNWRPNTKSR